MSLRTKAVVAREIGKPPAVEEIEIEAPRHGEATATPNSTWPRNSGRLTFLM